MRPLDFLRWWLLRDIGGRRGFGNRRAVSSGGVGQLYAQGWEGQRLPTSVVGHFDDIDENETGEVSQGIWEVVCWSGDVGKLVVVFGNGSKNASQTGRGTMIGAFDGKEAWTGMQPCRRADASCRRRAIGLLC